MDPAKPSLELLRALTDEHVLRRLMRDRRLTRAELAAGIGLSKPTIGESVRRLTELGLLADTGERTPGGRGRGRVGSYYALAADVGTALAVSIGPEGVIAERVDPYGDVTARTERPISRPARPDDVAAALESAVTALHPAARDEPDGSVRPPGVAREPAAAGGGSRPRLAVVSAADPVDRATGRLLQLPDAPFLLGTLDPVAVLGSHVDGPVTVDNDVNWAARAEREQGGGPADSAYLYLGEGLGCAVISDGEVRRGAVGLAGELAHLVTIGPDGRATRLIEVFAQLGLRRAGTTAIDVERLITAAEGDSPTVTALAQAVGGVIAAIVALADPEVVILGGPWGSHPAIALAVTDEVAGLPRPLPIQVAALTGEPSLTGARVAAIEQLRSAIVAMAR